MYMRLSRVRYSAAVPKIPTPGLTPVPTSPASRTIRFTLKKSGPSFGGFEFFSYLRRQIN